VGEDNPDSGLQNNNQLKQWFLLQ